jgi:ABC-2 type transport system permease protein
VKLGTFACPTSNPVIVKELRGRMRGARAFVVVALYQLLLGGITILVFGLWWSESSYYGHPDPSDAGKIVFYVSIGFQLLAVTVLAPALTAGAITGERQKQTFDLLRTTLLPAQSIVGGKHLSALIFLLMVVLTSLPIASLAFLLGGITLLDFLIAFLLLSITAFGFSAQGVFVSTLVRTPLASTVISYVLVLLNVIVLPIVFVIVLSITDSSRYYNTGSASMWFDIVAYGMWYLACTSPLAAGGLTLGFFESGERAIIIDAGLSSHSPMWVLTPWLVFVICHVLLTVLLVRLSVRFVRRRHRA